MLTNYLKVFIRLFFRQTAFTLINILGLAVGLACCLVIALFVRHEFSFDRFFTNVDSLYRVSIVSTDPDGVVSDSAVTFFPVAPLLKDNFPDITAIARMRPRPSLITVGDASFREGEFKLVEPDFFRLFDLVWLEGDYQSAFSGATHVVVTNSFAEKYFGNGSALGNRTLTRMALT